MAVDIHPLVQPIAYLIGEWHGEGRGHYPTIADFSYREESKWAHDGRPFLFYEQKTWNLETGSPSHSEVGFWRPQPDGGIEIVLAHTNGVIEIQEGTVYENEIEVHSAHLASAPTAKTIEGLGRVFSVEGDTLMYELGMAFMEHELQNHLTATLKRRPD